ncbi:MAG: class D beta-lactamase [Rubrivivax sp.]|nr:class D beta-lactamase [Rubrivivax sp.]
MPSRRSVLSLAGSALVPRSHAAPLSEPQGFARFFQESGMTGTFACRSGDSSQVQVYNAARAGTRLAPASTFKVAHTIIGLEVGAVRDLDEVVPYGGKKQPFPQWEHDMSLREAFRLSAVPIYQTLARRIGGERMTRWLQTFPFGNGRTGDAIDRFWLDGPLAISALEQVEFVRGLAMRTLPTKERYMSAVEELMLQESTDSYALYAKTGWLFDKDPQLGWMVGFVRSTTGPHCFALNIDMAGPQDTAKRGMLARQCLRALGALQ